MKVLWFSAGICMVFTSLGLADLGYAVVTDKDADIRLMVEKFTSARISGRSSSSSSRR